MRSPIVSIFIFTTHMIYIPIPCYRNKDGFTSHFILEFPAVNPVLLHPLGTGTEQSFCFFQGGNPPSVGTGIVGILPDRFGDVFYSHSLSMGNRYVGVPLVKHAKRFRGGGKSPRGIHIVLRPKHPVNQHPGITLGIDRFCFLCDCQLQSDDAVTPRQGLDALENVCSRHCSFLKSRIAKIIRQILCANGHGSVPFYLLTFRHIPIRHATHGMRPLLGKRY